MNEEEEERLPLFTRLNDAIDSRINQFGEFIADAAEDKEGWTDDAVRGTLSGLQWIGNLPVLKQLGQLEEGLVGGVRNLAERQDLIDPRSFTYSTRIALAFAGDKAVGKVIKAGKLAKIGKNIPPPLKVHALGLDPTGATDDLMRQQAGFKMRLLRSIDPEDPTHYLGGTPGTKTIKFKYDRPQLFNDKEVQDYVFDAWQHRLSRINQGGKTQLMKGYDKILKNKSGQDFILVRKKDTILPRESPENYRLKSVKDVELQMIKERGFEVGKTPKQKELRQLQQSLQRLKTQKNTDLPFDVQEYYSAIMEYGDRAYLEHKIARGEHWFWSRVENPRKDDVENGLFTWVTEETGARRRNDPEQLRILFREPYKQLKDATETRLRRMNKDYFKGNDVDKLVIDIEDPMSGDIFRRSNPGNLIIRKAGTGQKVSVIPDFYEELGSTAFKEAWAENPAALFDPKIPKKYRAIRVKDIEGKKRPVFDPNGRPETIDEYRARIFETILDEALSGKSDYHELQARIVDDLAVFNDIFHNKLQRVDGTPWLRKPQWTETIIGEDITNPQVRAIQKEIQKYQKDLDIERMKDEIVSKLGTKGLPRKLRNQLKKDLDLLDRGIIPLETRSIDFKGLSQSDIRKRRLELEELRRKGNKKR